MVCRRRELLFPLALVCLCACRPPANQQATALEVKGLNPSAAAWFEDATGALGLVFKHESGATGSYAMPESIGSGGALFDFDNDGRLDIYLIHYVPPPVQVRNRLFHQQPDGRFRDVSQGSGLDVSGMGMGVAAGDVDNDGLVDVLLTEYGKTRLFRNRGAGRFEDISQAAHIDNTRWATGASFFDYDRDGWLDLVVVNYVDYSETIKCHDTRGAPEYCGPQGMQGTASRLFHNQGARGGGTVRFEDVSVSSGLVKRIGPALGVVCGDFDGDRWPDIFVADDGAANRLYINQKDGTFLEEAVQRGIAYNAFGAPVANMGVALGDVDGDGLSDVFVTHVSWEQHALWKQGPAGLFQDRTAAAGLGNLTRRGTGFGTLLADFDHDGDLDLAFVNGRIKRSEDESSREAIFLDGLDPFWRSYAQRNQLFSNDGTGTFQDMSDGNPALCGRAAVGRGLACGDIDNDGDLDLLVMNTGAPALLLRNTNPQGSWLIVEALDPSAGGRHAYGAEVTVRAGGRQWKRVVQPGYSYLVSNDPRVHFGLAAAEAFESIRIVWPDGTEELFPGGRSNRHLVLRKGSGNKS